MTERAAPRRTVAARAVTSALALVAAVLGLTLSAPPTAAASSRTTGPGTGGPGPGPGVSSGGWAAGSARTVLSGPPRPARGPVAAPHHDRSGTAGDAAPGFGLAAAGVSTTGGGGPAPTAVLPATPAVTAPPAGAGPPGGHASGHHGRTPGAGSARAPPARA